MRGLFAVFAASLAFASLATAPAWADAVQTSHGLSAFGDLKYPPDFTHFDYVNPDAPKGGEIVTTSTMASQTFDSLNAYIVKGDAADGLAAPSNLYFDSLMVGAADEPDAVYGLVASHVEFIPGKWVTFQMRPEAQFNDGTPLTAEDAKASFDLLKEKGHPAYKLSLRDVESAEVLSPHRIKYTFVEDAAWRKLPMLVGTLPIFSAKYYAENDFEESSLEIPLGSGPYRIGKIVRNQSIEYERREDYWAKDLPVNRGRFNFDRIRFEYFRDRPASLEALFAKSLNFREDFFSKQWATAYDVPPVEDGRIIRATLADGRPAGTQGYFINTRREKFADPRVREAIGMAFDFEWSNETLFYGLYYRTDSFFENAPFEAAGEPTEGELALLEPFRDQLPESVFGPAYVPPVTDGSGNRDRKRRKNLAKAMKLLDDAGWTLKEGKRYNSKGEKLEIEFLDNSASFARITNPFIQNLERLGIDARLRQVDRPQYQRRYKDFDFDIVTSRLVFSLTLGPELFNIFQSDSADAKGSSNLPGIKDPVVDALLEKIVEAQTRDEMETAARALDRVLRDGHYWVSQWSKASHTIAYWDEFGFPEIKPPYARAVLDTWWSKEAGK